MESKYLDTAVAFNSIVKYVFNLKRFDQVSHLTNKILDLNLTL